MLTFTGDRLDEGRFDFQPSQRRVDAWVINPGEPVVLRFGRCEVRPACREVFVDGSRKSLQPRPFNLLLYLIEHRHRVLPIDELLDAIWRDEEVTIGSLATAIARIRAVLGDGLSGDGTLIQTCHRVGYRFVATLHGE